MTFLLDGRPPGGRIPFRPGTTMTLTLRSKVAGAFAGRTFTSTLDGVPLAVSLNGDVLTVSATPAQTTTAGLGLSVWVVNEVISGTPEPIIVGYWEGSNDPAVTPGETTAEVVEGDLVLELNINVGGIAASVFDAHTALQSAHGWSTAGLQAGAIRWPGPVLTNHDRYWFKGRDFEGTAAYNAEQGTDVAPSHWDFDQATVERIKWQWEPGDGWLAYNVRIWWIQTGAATGNVVWRYKVSDVHLGDNPTEGLATHSSITVPVPGVLGTSFRYDDLALAVPVSFIDLGQGPIAPRIHSVIDRDAGNAADTANGDASIVAVSVTRA